MPLINTSCEFKARRVSLHGVSGAEPGSRAASLPGTVHGGWAPSTDSESPLSGARGRHTGRKLRAQPQGQQEQLPCCCDIWPSTWDAAALQTMEGTTTLRLWGRTLSKSWRETAAQPARRDRNTKLSPGLSGEEPGDSTQGSTGGGLGVAEAGSRGSQARLGPGCRGSPL